MSVRQYFQKTLGCGVWSNSEFAEYFEGHYEQWDFDKKRARVRCRTAVQRLASQLRSARKRGEAAQAVLSAGEELGALPLEAFEAALKHLVAGAQAAIADEKA